MTGTDNITGVVELFEQETEASSEVRPEPLDSGPLEAVALVEKKLKAQIGLIALAKRRDMNMGELQQALMELKELTGSILDDLDHVIPALSAGQPDAGPRPVDLFTHLTQLCAGFRATSGITCVLAVLPRHLRFNETATEILFRAVRELLTNVRQHSQATRVEISSEIGSDGALTLTVKDDGVGMPPGGHNRLSALETGAVGLSSIDLRLREIGGHMQIESSGGVCVRLVLPAHSVAANAAGARV
jgi:signal transduction histidine kinase